MFTRPAELLATPNSTKCQRQDWKILRKKKNKTRVTTKENTEAEKQQIAREKAREKDSVFLTPPPPPPSFEHRDFPVLRLLYFIKSISGGAHTLLPPLPAPPPPPCCLPLQRPTACLFPSLLPALSGLVTPSLLTSFLLSSRLLPFSFSFPLPSYSPLSLCFS